MRMTAVRALAALAVAAVIGACGPSSRAKGAQNPSKQPLPSFPPVADAPYELAHNGDLEQVAARYAAMKLNAPGRPALRKQLADEYARRLSHALAHKKTILAYEQLSHLVRLWTARELRSNTLTGLATYVAPIKKLRATLAKEGDDKRVLTPLYVLAAADPTNAAGYRNEIEDALAYGDELMKSLAGKEAQRARPIESLDHVADRWPVPEVINRLVKLYIDRQQVFAVHFRKHGADFRMMRAHGMGVLHTAWHIVRLYARAGRLDEALTVIDKIKGMGRDRDLSERLHRAMRTDAKANQWLRLAKRFEGKSDKRQKDFHAALAILRRALTSLDRAPALYVAAGDIADEIDEPDLAFRYYSRAYAVAKNRKAAEQLATLHNREINSLMFGSRPHAARARLRQFEALAADAQKRWPQKPLDTDLAHVYATMGRGYAGLGELDNARRYLQRSLAARPTLAAYEMTIRIAIKRDDYASARDQLAKALELPAKSGSDKLTRAAIMSLGTTASMAAGDQPGATKFAFGAISLWSNLLEKYQLGYSIKAEIFIEWGKVAWTINRKKQALQLFETVVEGAAKREISARTLSSMVSFLIVRGHYDLAVDAYYRVLGSHKADEEQKVYMSLWVMAEALRTKRDVDPLALAYLTSRNGSLWYDDLARLATGRADIKSLSSRATTRARRAELLYYGAVLKVRAADTHKIARMMRAVLDTQVVLFFEYDMAKLWLTRQTARASARR